MLFIAEPLRSIGVLLSPTSSLLWAPPTPLLPFALTGIPFPDMQTGGVNSNSKGLPRSCATLEIRAVPEQPRMAPAPQDLLSVPVFRRKTAGFTIADSLAAIDSVTRLYRVHFRYGSHFRSFHTLHNSLPPYAVELLYSRTGIREHSGLSPDGFLSIYTRLVAYRHYDIHVGRA